MKLTIYLNQEGDSFEVIKRPSDPHSLSRDILTPEEAGLIHPTISQIVLAKNKIEVVQALRTLKTVAEQDTKTITSYFFKKGEQINNYKDFVIKSVVATLPA